MSVTSRLAVLGLLLLAAAPRVAADDKEQLREKLKDTVVQGPWIYDDLTAGFAEAKKTGKPLLVVLRCASRLHGAYAASGSRSGLSPHSAR